MSKNLRRMVTIGLVVAMGILPMSAHSNMASAQEQEQTGTLVMTKEDEIDSFDDLAGMTLDLSDKNIVPDDKGKVEIDVSDAVQQGNMARTTVVYGEKKFTIENLSNFSDVAGATVKYRPIQNIYVTSKYVYVTQVYNDKNVKLSRCEIDTKNNSKASYINSMNLENVGHGQTLVPYTKKYEGVDRHYFLVCAGAIRSEGFDYWEAKSVGRIKYQPGATINQIDSFVNVEYSNKTRSLFANLRRCAVNLSIDGETMLMFKQSTSGNVQYSFYDFNEVNNIFNSRVSGDRNFKGTKLADACLGDMDKNEFPNGQLQGIDIDDNLNIYIVCDGDNTEDQKAKLSVIDYKTRKTRNYDLSWKVNKKLEIEGIQVRKNKIYIGASPKLNADRKTAYIFSIDRDSLI